MSPYIIVGLMLLLGALCEFYNRKSYKRLYKGMFLLLLLMLCFRYGQGTDYFAYQYIFEMLPTELSITKLLASSLHTEIGWKLLCVAFKLCGISYECFVAFIGLITMIFLDKFIRRHCPLKTVALFLAYPTLYLTYISSGLRQGLVICIFLGALLDLYLKKDYKKFIIGILLSSLFHSASIILFLLLFDKVKRVVLKYQKILIIGSWLVGIALAITGIQISVFGRTFSTGGAIGYVAATERVLSYVLIHLVYRKGMKNMKMHVKSKIEIMMFAYDVGMILYGALLAFPSVVSRLCYFYKVLEIAIFTSMLVCNRRMFPEASIVMAYVCLATCAMLLKNIDSYIVQGGYLQSINVFNYPYNNIFLRESYRYSVHLELLQ